ncbi:MAG: hypothetical protein HC815_33845 [Richelia sp. RM1_1_1]|nr:hypothetical protein [Richelia sp. RM1_1_1]
MLGGVKTFLGANKAVKKSAEGIDTILTTSTRNVETSVGRQCFVAGTEILTTEGEKNIEDIKVGDWVITDDPTTPGEIEKRQVTDTFIREADVIFDLYVDGEVISTTGEHPFWNPEKGWVEAKDLEVGSLLQTDEETFVDVDRIERREGKTTVYNFKVEGIPTYFVSELGILVHNICRFDGPKPKYHVNPAHVLGPKFNPKKTLLPDDAEEVFKKAVPDSATEPRNWYGVNEDGVIYRFADANDGTAHFSGRSDIGDGIRNITDYAKKRLGVKK